MIRKSAKKWLHKQEDHIVMSAIWRTEVQRRAGGRYALAGESTEEERICLPKPTEQKPLLRTPSRAIRKGQ